MDKNESLNKVKYKVENQERSVKEKKCDDEREEGYKSDLGG